MLRRPLLLASAVLALAASAPLSAAPPTDAQVDAFVTTVDAASKDITDPGAKFKATTDAVKANMADISWTEITIPQLEKLMAKNIVFPSVELRKALAPRLTELEKLPTVEGARAADILVACWPPPDEQTQEAFEKSNAARLATLERGLKHPAAPELFRSGKGQNMLRAVVQFPRETIQGRKLIEAAEPFITTEMTPSAAASLGGLLGFVMSEEYTGDKKDADRIRDKIAAAAQAAMDREDPRFKDDPKALERTRKALKDMHDQTTSAFARGELMDRPAPPIAFVWSSSDPAIKSWADLKGRVVVVDFWSTWCGPCVASFPKLRELQAKYKDCPVTILGVTSQQGFHIDRADGKSERIDCEGNLAKETGLMTGFIKAMDMTWPVVFSDKNVFNPDFGVRGIPHIAILAPDGKVRFNGLRPGQVAEDAERIDALLKEFGLPCPGGPVAGTETGNP